MTWGCLCWRCESLLFNAVWRHKLQRHYIRNKLIRVRKGCTFHRCIDCGKYYCPICRDQKLLGWSSYTEKLVNIQWLQKKARRTNQVRRLLSGWVQVVNKRVFVDWSQNVSSQLATWQVDKCIKLANSRRHRCNVLKQNRPTCFNAQYNGHQTYWFFSGL